MPSRLPNSGREPLALPPSQSINVIYVVRADKLVLATIEFSHGRPIHANCRGKSLAKHQFEKVFTVEEANALIPRMEILVRGLQVEAEALRARIRELARRHDSSVAGMPLSDLVERYPELKENAARMAEMAGQVENLGCFLKDIDQGLVDFPYEIEDDVVFLCWQSGERQIIAWHTIESGFSDRRPLPGVNKPYLN